MEHRLPDMANRGVNAIAIDHVAVTGRSQLIERKGEDLPTLFDIR